jgi:hypothetical protein
VYAYAGAPSNGGQGSVTITAAKGAKGKVDATGTNFYNWTGGGFIKSDAKTIEAAKASGGSNLVVFTGNTAGDITVQWNGTLGGSWTGASAIQIVEDKE